MVWSQTAFENWRLQGLRMDGLSNPTKFNWLCQACELTNQNQKVFIAIRFMHLTGKPSDWIPGILGLGSGWGWCVFFGLGGWELNLRTKNLKQGIKTKYSTTKMKSAATSEPSISASEVKEKWSPQVMTSPRRKKGTTKLSSMGMATKLASIRVGVWILDPSKSAAIPHSITVVPQLGKIPKVMPTVEDRASSLVLHPFWELREEPNQILGYYPSWKFHYFTVLHECAGWIFFFLTV